MIAGQVGAGEGGAGQTAQHPGPQGLQRQAGSLSTACPATVALLYSGPESFPRCLARLLEKVHALLQSIQDSKLTDMHNRYCLFAILVILCSRAARQGNADHLNFRWKERDKSEYCWLRLDTQCMHSNNINSWRQNMSTTLASGTLSRRSLHTSMAHQLGCNESQSLMNDSSCNCRSC